MPEPEAVTGTPEGAEDGNIEALSNADLQRELGDTQKLLLEQDKLITKLSKQVEKLAKTAATDPAEPPPADLMEFVGPQPPPEGFKRYAARFTDLTIVKQAGSRILVDGKVIPIPHVYADFSGGVYETDDPEMIEYLDNHPALNQDFWEDPFAVKRHSRVEVQIGVKHAGEQPRVPLSAPMQ